MNKVRAVAGLLLRLGLSHYENMTYVSEDVEESWLYCVKYLSTYPCNKETLSVVQHGLLQQTLLRLTLKTHNNLNEYTTNMKIRVCVREREQAGVCVPA